MTETLQKNSLDFSPQVFSKLLQEACEITENLYSEMEKRPAYQAFNLEEVKSWFDEDLPEQGMSFSNLLKYSNEKVLQTATNNMGPHMYGYVMAGGTQVSSIAELLSVTVNQNMGKWHLGPAMNEIEQRVIQWGADFIGYRRDIDGVPEQIGGTLVSGGSAANLTGLTVARNVFFEKYKIRETGLFGQKPFIVYGSNETHGCVDKSLELLGIGTNNYRKVQCNADYTIDLDALKKQIEQDKKDGLQPFCVIGNAGTVNTGALDNLEALADIAQAHGLWFHVDGAYGGLVASLDSHKHLYKGMERADSVAVDFHKWLYQPFEVGCCLVKNWDLLKKTYYKRASYLSMDVKDDGRLDLNDHHFQLSRNAKAFKVWMSFKAYGAQAFRDMIQKDVDLTKYLARCVDSASDFKLFNEPELSAVCFQYIGDGTKSVDELNQLNQKIIHALEEDGRVFIPGSQLLGQTVIRACLINHRKQKEHVDQLVDVIREIAESLDI